MREFDLSEALMGNPVVLKNGDVVVIDEVDLDSNWPLKCRKEGLSWTLEGLYLFSEVVFDIIGMYEELKFYCWSMLRDDVKYIAKDECGGWFGFTEKPDIRIDVAMWIGEVCYSLGAINSELFPDCHWKQSLIERPEQY